MKKSLALAVAILLLGGATGFFQQQHLTQLRNERRELPREATKPGGFLDSAPDPSVPRITKRLRAERTRRDDSDDLPKPFPEPGLTPSEKVRLANELTCFTTKADTGRWVEWMSGNLPEEHLAEPVRKLIGEWTEQDYVAAGKWLATAPDGPAKVAAVEAYARAVARYEPHVAGQWAMTLPPGAARNATLRAVHQNWPADDPEGAAGFAHEHGLE
jgi:hypothetical protein